MGDKQETTFIKFNTFNNMPTPTDINNNTDTKISAFYVLEEKDKSKVDPFILGGTQCRYRGKLLLRKK